jgi:subtilisin
MTYKKIAYFLAFLLVLGSSGFANAATDDTRFLVKSQSGFWKKSFGVRHEFNEGFTTDLNDWQLRLAKVFGVEVVPVAKVFILADIPVTTPSVEGTTDPAGNGNGDVKGKPTPSPVARSSTPSTQLPWGIKAIYNNEPTLVKTSGGAGVNVAVLDTGIYREHLDLKNRIAQCKDFTTVKPAVTDGKCDDKNGHGTHVAGTIAADGGADGKGIYGVAPEANLFAYKVCGANGSCWSDDIADAIRMAADKGANIISISLGSDGESSVKMSWLLPQPVMTVRISVVSIIPELMPMLLPSGHLMLIILWQNGVPGVIIL